MLHSFEQCILRDQNVLESNRGLLPADEVACVCNPATLEAKFWNDVGSIPVGGTSPSIGEWIV